MQEYVINCIASKLKPHIHERPNARMRGRGCEPAPCHPRTIRIPFAENQMCRFFAQTPRELDAPGVLSMHRVSFARLRFAEN